MTTGRENSHQTGVGKELRGWHVRVIHMDTLVTRRRPGYKEEISGDFCIVPPTTLA